MAQSSKQRCEYLRHLAKQKFDQVRPTWIDLLQWTIPYRAEWLLSQQPGARVNRHIVDSSHLLALRSFVAGFLEGNTSASRPWFRIQAADPDINKAENVKSWMDIYNDRCLKVLSSSNYYHSAGQFYYDFGSVNTGAHFIDELPGFRLYYHNLIPGSYYVINNKLGEAIIMVREFSLTVKAIVDAYGRVRNGKPDWSNISKPVRKMYEDGNYTQMIDCVQVVEENTAFDVGKPVGGVNRQWVSKTYETGTTSFDYAQITSDSGSQGIDPTEDPDFDNRYLMVSYSKRKPFIVGKSFSNGNFEYGQTGPTLDALGLIKSLNKKAIGKDQALEQMLRPPMQGPATLRKSYLSSLPNSFLPLDPTSAQAGGMKPIMEVRGEGVAAVIGDVADLRSQVDKHYYADYLLYLTKNPKTRTATETTAIVEEQQRIIGPNLQSLNWSYNTPVVDFVMDYVLDNDPYLPDPPAELEGTFLRAEFISIFAQAQKAADLPSIDRYVGAMMGVAQMDPRILDKVNLDRYADLYEDRLFLPAGLNNPQSKVEATREQAARMKQRQEMMQQTIPALAGAAKDVGLQVQKGNEAS